MFTFSIVSLMGFTPYSDPLDQLLGLSERISSYWLTGSDSGRVGMAIGYDLCKWTGWFGETRIHWSELSWSHVGYFRSIYMRLCFS